MNLGDKIKEVLDVYSKNTHCGTNIILGSTEQNHASEELDQLIESHKRVEELEKDNNAMKFAVAASLQTIDELKEDAELIKALKAIDEEFGEVVFAFVMFREKENLAFYHHESETNGMVIDWYKQQQEKEDVATPFELVTGYVEKDKNQSRRRKL